MCCYTDLCLKDGSSDDSVDGREWVVIRKKTMRQLAVNCVNCFTLKGKSGNVPCASYTHGVVMREWIKRMRFHWLVAVCQ